MNQRHLDILRAVLSRPVSPFHEEAVVALIRRWAAGRGVAFDRDRAGNVLLHYRRGRARKRRWILTAHMDHPGFVATGRRGRTVTADFRGGVREEYVVGSAVRLFAPGGEVAAVVERAEPLGRQVWWRCRLRLDEPADIPAGTIGMWDLPAFRRRGRRISARACDDLAGTAAVLCAFDELAERRVEADVLGLLTRAEEAGFVGALAACRCGSIPPNALMVSIEASRAQPAAPLGGGAVVRVGDRARTFDPALTALLWEIADEIRRARPDCRFVRSLMPGGTCESTAFAAFGHRAAAVCLPLGNYHNMAPSGRIAPERIDTGDFASLVALLAALAQCRRMPRDADAALRRRMEGIWRARRDLLKEPGRYPPQPPPALAGRGKMD